MSRQHNDDKLLMMMMTMENKSTVCNRNRKTGHRKYCGFTM